MWDNDLDNAVKMLAISKDFAIKRDSYNKNGTCNYSCTIFDHVTDDLSCELLPADSTDCWKDYVNKTVFDPLREREDFNALIR